MWVLEVVGVTKVWSFVPSVSAPQLLFSVLSYHFQMSFLASFAQQSLVVCRGA